MDDVVQDLEAAVSPRKAGIGPDPGQEARVGQRRTLNGEAIELHVIGHELHWPTSVMDDRLGRCIRDERPRPRIDARLRAEQGQIVLVDLDLFNV